MVRKPIIIKAVLLGLAAQIILNILMAVFVFASMNEIFNDIGSFNEKDLPMVFFTSPNFLAILFLEIIVCAFLPGYIAARIANKNYILHGAVIGVVAGVWTMRTVMSEQQYPLVIGLSILFAGIFASTAGGWYRKIQLRKIS